MNNQPENCERCGAKLQIDGEPCYQKNCSYLKEEEEDLLDGVADEVVYQMDEDEEGTIANGVKDLKDGLNDVKELVGGNSAVETSSSGDNSDSVLSDIGEEVADGCVWSVLKFFWYVITLPFRIIFNIFAFFFDD